MKKTILITLSFMIIIAFLCSSITLTASRKLSNGIDTIIKQIGGNKLSFTGALEGTVTDYDGIPIQYVRVSIAGGTVYTDENGHYLAAPVEVGVWDIPFYHEDYTEQWYYDVEIDEGDTTLLDAVLGNPTMEIYPDSLYVELPPYSSTTRTLTITNNGTIDLDWYISLWDKTNKLYNSDESKTRGDSPGIYAESDPDAGIHTPPSSDEIWDIMFSYDADTPTGGFGIAGAEFGNGYFLVSEWGYSSRNVFKFNYDGTYAGSWEPTWMPGTGGLRDMTFDGEYFYGSNAGTTIYQFDEDGNLIGTIYSPVDVRAIAYDEINDAFWVNNWNETLTLINRSGSVLNTIASPPSMYGCAYDNVSTGGPFLWIFTGTTTGAGCQIEQYDLNTMTLTGVTHSVDGDFGANSYIAGGLFTSGEIVPGAWVLGGIAQGSPTILFGYELCPSQIPPHVVFEPNSGTVEPFGGTQDVTVSFYAYNDPPGTIYSGDVIFRSPQNVPPVTVSICLKIIPPTLDYGTITGIITDHSGNPIEGAQVLVYYDENYYTTYTDSNGFYVIEEIFPGDYFVEISADGYNTYTTPDYISILPLEVTTLNISLTAPIMVVNPDSIYVTLLPGESTIEFLTISNVGDGPMDFALQIYTNDKTETDYSRFTCNDELLVLKDLPITGTSAFTATQDREDTIIQYQNGYNNNGIGTGGVFSAIAAARFTPDELDPYYNSNHLNQVNIHIRSVDFTLVELKVWEGGSFGDPGVEVYSQDITNDIVIDDWTHITFTTPIPLVSSNEYWIGYAIDVTADHPCSVDAGPAVAGKGDWMYYNGSWVKLSTAYALDFNWCIQGVLSPNPLSWISVDPTSGTIPPNDEDIIDIPISAINLNPGDIKTANIVISTNPDVGVVTIPITLHVYGWSQDELQVTETSLRSNFPNPVLNNTTFEFSLKEPSQVTLSIYNLKGQLVATLLDEEFDPSASHCVEWDGTANGSKLANGIYFYKLEADKKSFLKKMVLMR